MKMSQLCEWVENENASTWVKPGVPTRGMEEEEEEGFLTPPPPFSEAHTLVSMVLSFSE